MEENNVQKTADQLINWSKWLITLSFSAGVGCVLGLKTASDTALQKTGTIFFLAVLSFCLSIVCSAIFVLLLSDIKQHHVKNGRIKFRWLASLQMALFSTGLLFVLLWIARLGKVI
jgi:hypothetical protein